MKNFVNEKILHVNTVVYKNCLEYLLQEIAVQKRPHEVQSTRTGTRRMHAASRRHAYTFQVHS